MSDKPEVYIFDFWLTLGTSLSEDPIATFYRQLGLHLRSSEMAPTAEFMTACLTTNISRPKRFVDRICRAFGVTPTERIYREFRELVKSERLKLSIFADTHPALTALKNSGSRLGLLSNLWPFPVNAIFARNKLAAYFEHRIYSFDSGARKPDAKIFLEACARFNVEPSRCLMIGDSLSSDILGALSIGMPAALLVRSGEVPAGLPEGTRVIRSLLELCS